MAKQILAPYDTIMAMLGEATFVIRPYAGSYQRYPEVPYVANGRFTLTVGPLGAPLAHYVGVGDQDDDYRDCMYRLVWARGGIQERRYTPSR